MAELASEKVLAMLKSFLANKNVDFETEFECEEKLEGGLVLKLPHTESQSSRSDQDWKAKWTTELAMFTFLLRSVLPSSNQKID